MTTALKMETRAGAAQRAARLIDSHYAPNRRPDCECLRTVSRDRIWTMPALSECSITFGPRTDPSGR